MSPDRIRKQVKVTEVEVNLTTKVGQVGCIETQVLLIISILAIVLACFAIFLFIWTLAKIRTLSAALLLASSLPKSSALPSVPSFHYSSLLDTQPTNPTVTDHVYRSFLTPWPYVTLSVLTSIFIVVSAYVLWQKFKSDHKTCLFLEITTGSECSLIKVATLSLCPYNWSIQPPQDISGITLSGTFLPCVHIEWTGLSITNMTTKRTVMPQNIVRVSPFKARKLARILRQPYTAYIIMCHS